MHVLQNCQWGDLSVQPLMVKRQNILKLCKCHLLLQWLFVVAPADFVPITWFGACTFPSDITNCILRIGNEGFNSDGSMTPNFSGTLETVFYHLSHAYKSSGVHIGNPILFILLQRRECCWMISALHLLFSSGTVSEYVETSELKKSCMINFSVIYQKIISCDLCCLLHCLSLPLTL